MANTRRPPSDYSSPEPYHPAPEPPPSHFPNVPAPTLQNDFTPQIIDLNKSVSSLEAKTARLIADVSEQEAKLERVVTDFSQSVRDQITPIANKIDDHSKLISDMQNDISTAKGTIKGVFYTSKWFVAAVGGLFVFILDHITWIVGLFQGFNR
jgi:hypothetical protein